MNTQTEHRDQAADLGFPPIGRIADLQDALDISRTSAYALVRAGRIRSVRIGAGEGAIRIPRTALNEFLEGGDI